MVNAPTPQAAAGHTPMMQRGLFRVKTSSFFPNVSQCVSHVDRAWRSTFFPLKRGEHGNLSDTTEHY